VRTNSALRLLVLVTVVLLAAGWLSSCSSSGTQGSVAETTVVDDGEPMVEATTPATSTPEPSPIPPTHTPEPTPVPPTATPQVVSLVISEPAVIQSEDGEVLCVFFVENPSQDSGVERASYATTLLDADGKELKVVSEQPLPVLLPGQRIGVTVRASIEGGSVAKAEIALVASGASVARSELQSVIDRMPVAEILEVAPPNNPTFTAVTGVITNALDVDLVSPSVYIIAYDSAGQVVGGGRTYVGFVLPNDSSAFAQNIMLAGEVDRAEAYLDVTSFRHLQAPTTVPAGASAPILVNSGYGRNKRGTLEAVILLSNPNSGYRVWENVMMAAYAQDGSLLDVVWDQISLSPNTTMGLSRAMFLSSNAEVERVDFKVLAVSYKEAEAVPEFPYTVSQISAGSFGQVVTGEISNPTSEELAGLIVHAIAFDEVGQITGASRARVDSLPANGKADLEFDFALESTPAKVEFYPELDSRP